MADELNANKNELMIGINNFNKPAEATGVAAWANLITRLLFMKKGTYPTDPEMGCDIGKYEFMFIDDVIDEIEEVITTQVRTYLPDIPFDSVTISSETTDSGRVVLLIVMEFTYNGNERQSAVVAAEKVQNNLKFALVA